MPHFGGVLQSSRFQKSHHSKTFQSRESLFLMSGSGTAIHHFLREKVERRNLGLVEGSVLWRRAWRGVPLALIFAEPRIEANRMPLPEVTTNKISLVPVRPRRRDARGRYFCRLCRRYKWWPEFWPSFIKSKRCVCKRCATNHERRDRVVYLRRKLYKQLHRRGLKRLAKSITTPNIKTLLNGMDPNRVVRIEPPTSLDELMRLDLRSYRVVLRGVSPS